MVIDHQQHILRINPKLAEMSGKPLPELIGMPFESLFEAGGENRLERELKCSSGKPIPVQINIAHLHSPRAEEDTVVVVHDLREHMRAEAREQYAAFQAGLAEMSTHIIHNVGNAIQGLDGAQSEAMQKLQSCNRITHLCDELIDELEHAKSKGDQDRITEIEQYMVKVITALPNTLGDLSEQFSTPLESISRGISHIKEVIKSQQRSSRIDDHVHIFPMTELIEDLYILTRSDLMQHQIQWQNRMDRDASDVTLPRNQLLQALINLVHNSIDAIQERIRHKHLSPGEGQIRISTTQSLGTITIRIGDNGIGIPQENHRKLLKFGFTTKPQRSGFGLHATGNFVSSCHGKIEINSDGINHGTEVILELPFS